MTMKISQKDKDKLLIDDITDVLRDVFVKDLFVYRGKVCVVVSVSLGGLREYHNGYVEARVKHCDNLNGKYQQAASVELTYSGKLEHFQDFDCIKGRWFVGFDTAHLHNEENPITKTFVSVKKETIRLAKELDRAGL